MPANKVDLHSGFCFFATAAAAAAVNNALHTYMQTYVIYTNTYIMSRYCETDEMLLLSFVILNLTEVVNCHVLVSA